MLGALGGIHGCIDMKITVLFVVITSMLYHNWTDMGVDNERVHLDKIKNSRGFLEKVKE